MHRNGINSLVVGYPEEGLGNSHVNLFSASKDRLIKLWDVDYSQGARGVNLLCDLDAHTDWVNQIKLIETANTLVSCSNDTTIRIWRLQSSEDYWRKQ